MTRMPAPTRNDFVHFVPLTLRWNDIDVFGHVNNAEFFAFFDTAILDFLHGLGAIQGRLGDNAILVAESGARYHKEVLFSDRISVGIAVVHLGQSSVQYRLGVFSEGEDSAAVDGHFVHVFTDRETRRPVPIPDRVRRGYESIQMAELMQ